MQNSAERYVDRAGAIDHHRSHATLDHMAKDLTTGQAAEAVGLSVGTLRKYVRDGLITPTSETPTGHMRWNIDDLRRQLAPKRRGERRDLADDHYGPQPVVAAIVTSSLGVLIGKRRDGQPPWTFIAGEMEPGEDPADAAVREVKEETGVSIRAGEFIGTRVHPATRRLMLYMAAEPTGDLEPYVGDRRELAEVRWVPLAEADQLLPGMFRPVRDYLARVLPLT